MCVKDPWRLADLQVETRRRWWEEDVSVEGDALIVLAYEPPPEDAQQLTHELEVNAAGAERVARAAARAGARVVFASSADVYGRGYAEPVAEDASPAPATPYAQAKLEAEGRLSVFDAVSLRIATVFGPGEDGPRAIPSFVRAFRERRPPVIHGDGSDARDYVHVSDVAAALLNAAISPTSDVLNVGSGVARSTLEILEAVQRMTKRVVPSFEPSARPPSRLALRWERAHQELGFTPRSDFEEALAEEIDWLLAESS
jgi:UDP-glucose 4-epimerase